MARPSPGERPRGPAATLTTGGRSGGRNRENHMRRHSRQKKPRKRPSSRAIRHGIGAVCLAVVLWMLGGVGLSLARSAQWTALAGVAALALGLLAVVYLSRSR